MSQKMTSWTSYPKIYNLGHRAVRDVTKGPVYVEEKVDGSQFSFGIDFDGKLRARSRNKEIDFNAPEKMFIKAFDTVCSLIAKLQPGWTYRGEYLSKPSHNSLTYDRVPEKNIIIYDVNTGDQEYLGYKDKATEAARLGLQCVPLLQEGYLALQSLKHILDTESILGGPKIEGVVIKPVDYNLYGQDGKALMAKHVSEEFKEVHQRTWKDKNPSSKDFIATMIMGLTTQQRWLKAVYRLRDSGELKNDPTDIGTLIKAVQLDVHEEEHEAIAATLYNHHKQHIQRGVVAGFAEWYKERLMKSQFDDNYLEELKDSIND